MQSNKSIKELYKAFLQASSVRYSSLALSQVSPFGLSHDTISRWLKTKQLRPRDVWKQAKADIDINSPCVLIVDDTVINKEHSSKIELVKKQYSGNKHGLTPGIGLVNMVWYGLEQEQEESLPIDYRIYDQDTDGKNKNEHFRNMLTLAKNRGIKPEAVVMDTWYSSLKNLKAIRNHGWDWIAPLKSNRQVNKGKSLKEEKIPEEGCEVHLRGYGWIKVFKIVATNGRIDYVGTNKKDASRHYVESMMKTRWSIEVYHRELKQTCGLERCQARQSRSQRNHIYMAIMAWFDKHRRFIREKISFYEQDWQLIKDAITQEISLIMRLV